MSRKMQEFVRAKMRALSQPIPTRFEYFACRHCLLTARRPVIAAPRPRCRRCGSIMLPLVIEDA